MSLRSPPLQPRIHDPNNYRILKTDSQGRKDYLLEGEHLEAVYHLASPRVKYLRGAVIDEIVNGYTYEQQGGIWKWVNYTYHHDHLQSVVGLSGHEGSVLQTTQYTAFGQDLSTTGSSPNRLKYTGREQDADTGLYYYRARYYDPVVGRFLTEDPKGFGAGVNFYAYVNNNPVNANDPSGLEVGDWWDVPANIQRANELAQTTSVEARELAMRLANNDPAIANQLLHNGLVDAWRHAEWSLRATQEVGPVTAWVAGVGHEVDNVWDKLTGDGIPGQTWEQFYQETMMDLSNDRLGRIANVSGENSISLTDQNLMFGSGGLGGQREVGIGDYLAGPASGGFVLYPNRPNLNMMQSVYSK